MRYSLNDNGTGNYNNTGNYHGHACACQQRCVMLELDPSRRPPRSPTSLFVRTRNSLHCERLKVCADGRSSWGSSRLCVWPCEGTTQKLVSLASIVAVRPFSRVARTSTRAPRKNELTQQRGGTVRGGAYCTPSPMGVGPMFLPRCAIKGRYCEGWRLLRTLPPGVEPLFHTHCAIKGRCCAAFIVAIKYTKSIS